MSRSAFETATTWERRADGRYHGAVDESWYQGRSIFGGVVAAGLLRAMADTVGDARRVPRTLHVHFCAPVEASALEVECTKEREGSLVSCLSARLWQNGKTAAVATATFAGDRGGVMHRFPRADFPHPGPHDVEPVPENPLMPTFAAGHFEYRFCVGAFPYSGDDGGRLGGWFRTREPSVGDAPLLAALLDAWPPSATTLVTAPVGAASVDFRVDFFSALPRPDIAPDALYLLTADTRVVHHGYADEVSHLYAEDGTLLARGTQLVALLGQGW